LGYALAFRRDPLRVFTYAARTAGPVARIRIGPTVLYLVTKPAQIQQIFTDAAGQFGRSRFVAAFGRRLFGQAVSMLEGETWIERRQLVRPAVEARRMAGLAPVVTDSVVRIMDSWRKDGERVLDGDIMRMSVTGLGRILCGVDIDAHATELAAGARQALSGLSERLRLGIPVPAWVPVRRFRDLATGTDRMRRVVDRIVDEKSAMPLADDYLSILLRHQRSEASLTGSAIREDLAIEVGIGGHQIATALNWIVHCLANAPDADRRLDMELRGTLGARSATYDDLHDLSYTSGVVDEALRLYPPFYFIPRTALESTTVAGIRLPKGATVAISPWVTHRDPDLFEAADSFRPERWSNRGSKELPAFAYLPFGGGARACIAARLVRTFLIVATATLFQRCRFEAIRGVSVTPVAKTSLVMSQPLRVRVERRTCGIPRSVP